TPMANCMEPDSPLGVSVYAAASQLIEQAEQQWERIEWEYKGSELAVDASEDLFEHRRDGSVVLPQGQERLFRAHDLDIGQSGGKFLEVFSPEIRDRALFCGLDSILRRIEFNCGLAYGTISDPQQVERTAQEVRAGRQRSYAMVCDLQGALEAALRELCEVLDIWATVYELCPDEPWQLRVCWGDSVLVDSETLRESHRKDVAAGLMSVQEYRAVWYGDAAMQEKGREEKNA
ncbi:MAG: phage portal protein, partial [Angelakisella sp.]